MTDGQLSPWRLAGLAALLFIAFGGYVKGVPGLDEFRGLDTTVLAAAVLFPILLVGVVGRAPISRGGLWVVALAAAFAFPGVVLTGIRWDSYTGDKLLAGLVLMLASMTGGLVLGRDKVGRAAWAWAIVAFGGLMVVLLLLFPERIVGGSDAIAIAGSNAISLGRGCGAAVTVLAVLALFGKYRLFVIPAALGLTGVMIASGSRGPVFSVMTAFFFVAALAPGRRAARLVLASSGAVVALYLVLASDVVTYKLGSRLTSLSDQSAQARRNLWEVTTPLLWKEPTGVGWGHLREHLPAWASVSFVSDEVYPHNVLLEIGVEGGLLALATFLLVFFVAARRQRAAAAEPFEAALLALLVFFFLNALVSGDLSDNRGLWVAIGLGLALPATASSAPPHEGDGALVERRTVRPLARR